MKAPAFRRGEVYAGINSTIIGGEGDDEIKEYFSDQYSNYIDAGKGDDKIYTYANNGSGNDMIYLYGTEDFSDLTIADITAGNDGIYVYAAVQSINKTDEGFKILYLILTIILIFKTISD